MAAEAGRLERWLQDGRCCEEDFVAGCELESWLIDRNFFPVAENERFLARLAHPLVVPELSRFNVELSATPEALTGRALSRIEAELAAT